MLRTLLSPFVIAICALAVLPPSGFALCVDADGHWVIETDLTPGAMCCLAETDDEACTVDACDACIDVALAASSALRSPDAGLDDAPPATTALALPDLELRLDAAPEPVTTAAAPAPVPALHTVSLRI